MQTFEVAESQIAPGAVDGFSVRQKLLSASLTLAMGGSFSAPCALANVPTPNFTPHAPSAFGASSSGHSPFGSLHSSFGAPVSPSVSASIPSHATAPPSAVPANWHGLATHATFDKMVVHSPYANRDIVQNAVRQATGANDLNLASANAIFQAGGLAGFHDITLIVGGKQQQISLDSKLTAAELVAAQQVLSGGKQEITINANGIATGGHFNLNNTTVSALDAAVGGNVGSLVISRGVHALDSLSNLSLMGSLINLGSLVVGVEPGKAGGQTVDAISAANIYNGLGGVISSSTVFGVLAPTGISLSTPGVFFNSGVISSSSTLSITAPTITNVTMTSGLGGGGSAVMQTPATIYAAQNVNLNTQVLDNAGLIAAAHGNINIVNGGGNNNIVVNGAGGVMDAAKGNINFNQSNYAGSGNITVSGGDYYSKQMNFNAGTGAVEVNVGQVSGVINGTAGSSHITAASADMKLGDICVSGDPTYFNTQGDISITGKLTGNPDLAIIASGNIIGAGGSLDTTGVGVDGGSITLVAGANISKVTPAGNGTGGTATAGNGDDSSTITLSNSSNKFGGSVTGGFIDLSGINLTATKGSAITTIDSSSTTGKAGAITMVAYQGTGKNSGSVIATASQSSTAEIKALGATGDGDVTIIGGGSILFAQNIEGGKVTFHGGSPTLTADMNITKGTVSGGTFTTSALTNTEVLVGLSGSGNINGSGSLKIDSAGFVDIQGVAHVKDADLSSTKNFVEGFYLSTAGAGGVSGVGSGDGANGGSINIKAAGIFYQFLDSSGGGGAGGNTTAAGGNAGGKGGNAGAVNLEATSNNIQISGFLNASGGGGGGGGGAAAGQATGGAGGAGGHAAPVTIKTPFSFIGNQPFGYTILDFDGAAGGAGGASAILTNAGGGGGGGTAFGGGGGGGAAGIGGGTVTGGGGAGVYFLGAGGGGAGTTTSTVSATGGGGGSSTGKLGVIATGGVGGTASNAGFNGGTATYKGTIDSNGGAGGNSRTTPTNTGGQGGIKDAPGVGGANGGGGTDGFASSGKDTTTEGGFGTVDLTVGAATGSTSNPVVIDTSTLTLTGTTKAASIFVGIGGQSIVLQSVKMVSGSTLEVSESHNKIIVSGPITGASNVTLVGWGGVQINGNIDAAGVVNVAAGMGAIPNTSFFGIGGDITGSGVITAPTVNLSALKELGLGGNIALEVAANSISANGTGTNVLVTVDTSAGKVTNFTSGSVASTGNFKITTTGAGSIGTSKAITGGNVTVGGSATVGSAAKPFLTTASSSITATGTTSNPIFIKDSNTAALTVSGSGAPGEPISITSAAKTLTVNNLQFAGVTLQDTYKGTGGSVLLASLAGNQVGNGTGAVSVITADADIKTGAAGNGIAGTSVNLLTTGGSIGAGTSLIVATPVLTASAAKGSVDVTDSSAVTVNAGTALNNYNVTATGITVAGAITAGKIKLTGTAANAIVLNAAVGGTKTTDVNISSMSGISQNKSAVITATNVILGTSAGNIGSSLQYVFTKASGTLEIDGANGQSSFVNQNGKAVLNGNFIGTTNNLNLIDQSALSINGLLTYNTLNITAPSVNLSSGGTVIVSNISLTAPVVTMQAGSTITAKNATFQSAGGLSISGLGQVIVGTKLLLGGTINGKTTSSITLGDKTGGNNPLAGNFDSTAGGTISNLTITTTGNFTSGLTAIKLAPDAAGNGGVLKITAANFVSTSNPSFAPIQLFANGQAGKIDGSVFLTLTGTQPVVLDNVAGTSKTGAPYQLQVNAGGGAAAGRIEVKVGGTLTASSAGIGLNTAAKGGRLVLSGAKGLVVKDDVFQASYAYDTVVLGSGSKSNFVVDGGASITNGTANSINGVLVSIDSAGTIVTNKAGDITATSEVDLANSAGTLTVLGNAGGIVTGLNVTLTGKSGITLGDAKLGVGNPLDQIGNSKLNTLVIDAGSGNFTSPISSFKMDSTLANNNLSINAANVVVTGTPLTTPILLQASSSTTAGQVTLTLTGTQAVGIDTVASASAKAPNYEIINHGPSGKGSVTVQTSGPLTVSATGIDADPDVNLSLNGGKGLLVQAGNPLLNGSLSSLTLTSGATSPLQIGPSATSTNAVISDLKAGSLTVTCLSGINVLTKANITATDANGGVDFETKSFVNDGAFNGQNGPNSFITFGVGVGTGTNPLTIVTGGNGSYGGFKQVSITANGNIDLGNLFTSTLLLDGLPSVSINTPGSVTFSPTNPGMSVADNGQIFITAGSITTKSSTPITFSPSVAAPSTISIITKSGINLANTKGGVFITSQPQSIIQVVSTGGAVTINDDLSGNSVSIQGTSISSSKAVTGTMDLTLASTGSSGAISTSGAGVFTSGHLFIGQANTKMGKTAINVDSAIVSLGGVSNTGQQLGGALFINNTNSSGVSLGEYLSVGSLNYTGTGGTVVGSIDATAGGIKITSLLGNLSVGSGQSLSTNGGGITLLSKGPGSILSLDVNSSLSTKSGSIVIENDDTSNGKIVVNTGVNIHASGTAKGVGQVSLVLGPVPTTGLLPGGTPLGGFPPTVITSGGANVTYTTTANPTGTFTSAGAGNVLNAEGRNVVINANGNSGNIILNGNDVIVADPPAGAAASAASSSVSAPVAAVSANLGALNLASNLSSASISAPVLTASLTPLLAGLSNLNANQLSANSQPAVRMNGGKPLAGGIANVAQAFLGSGPMFIAPDVNTSVKTDFGSVDVAANSVALIIAFDGGIAVYNFHDDRRDSVVISSGAHKLSIAPGRHAVITNRNVHYFQEVNPAEFVGYRKMKGRTYTDGIKTFAGEFDLRTLLQGVEPLKQMVRSTEARDQRVTRSMLKTAAILMSIGDSTPFEYMAAPRLSAMNVSR
ncbi:MAG: hypothetical protein JSS83_19510 [Cyanobacteria bacterium SZAS LIN-3]|nr:hypothetical protein [Cyanobacteria bacterium SZAS LIN-3]